MRGAGQATAGDFVALLQHLPRQPAQVAPALFLAHAMLGGLTDAAVGEIAAHFQLTVNDVEGVALGYPMLRQRPPERRLVRVCQGPTCLSASGAQLLAVAEAEMRAGTGGRGGVQVVGVPCCFLCDLAPVMEIDGVCRGRCSETIARVLLRGLLAGTIDTAAS